MNKMFKFNLIKNDKDKNIKLSIDSNIFSFGFINPNTYKHDFKSLVLDILLKNKDLNNQDLNVLRQLILLDSTDFMNKLSNIFIFKDGEEEINLDKTLSYFFK